MSSGQLKHQYHSINQGPGMYNIQNSNLNQSFTNKSGGQVSKTKQLKQKYDESYLNRPIMEESYVQRPNANSQSHTRVNSTTQ